MGSAQRSWRSPRTARRSFRAPTHGPKRAIASPHHLTAFLRWTPKTGQGPKVENRCCKEGPCKGSGNNIPEHSKRKSRWKRSKDNGQCKRSRPATAFILIRSQSGRNSWWTELATFSRLRSEEHTSEL